jgi:hypothetical protein
MRVVEVLKYGLKGKVATEAEIEVEIEAAEIDGLGVRKFYIRTTNDYNV